MTHPFAKIIILVSLCLLTPYLLHPLAAETKQKITPELDRVLRTTAESETVRVILRFQSPKLQQAKTSLNPYESNISLAQRKEMISEARKALFASRPSRKSSLVGGTVSVGELVANSDTATIFSYSPMIGVELTPDEIDTLNEHPLITQIMIDEVLTPDLSESTMHIGMPAVWAQRREGQGEAIAVLDTGLDTQHSFFDGRVVEEACFSSNTSRSQSLCPNGANQMIGIGASANCEARDACKHGTHVTAIAAGNGSSLDGVARHSTIVSIQVFSHFNTDGEDDLRAWSSDVIAGLEHVLLLSQSMQIAAANMSLGSGSYSEPCTTSRYEETARLLTAQGVGVIASAGNRGLGDAIGSPACAPSIISVGSTDDTSDDVSSYSNAASFLDVLAPGRSITSAYPDDRLATLSGTSMSAPHVAGAFAVIKSAFPAKSVGDILQILQSTGAPVADYRNNLTFSRIDVEAAVDQLNTTQSGFVYVVTPTDDNYAIIPVKRN